MATLEYYDILLKPVITSIPSTQTAREREGVWFMVSQQRPRKPL